MQRSFSIIDDDSSDNEIVELQEKHQIPPSSADKKQYVMEASGSDDTIIEDSDPEETAIKVRKVEDLQQDMFKIPRPAKQERIQLQPPPPPPPKNIPTNISRTKMMSSESDLEESDNEFATKQYSIPDEYNPEAYKNLEVDDEVKEIFQYITKYTPQQLTLDYKFKPFIPDFLPAVGDIDAFLKVIPPDFGLSGEYFDVADQQLGIAVLDEPATNQSDPALLHLQLRAANLNVSQQNDSNMVVKKVDNIEKNAKTIEKWIKDISDLHKSKSSPVVRYSTPMPDLDDLMQEWPEEMEGQLKEFGFPLPKDAKSLADYIDLVCGLFQIPVHGNKIESVHLLLCLYAAVKNSQLYKAANINQVNAKKEEENDKGADQLVLD